MELNFSFASIYDASEIVKLVNSAYRGDSSRQGWTTEADLLSGQRTDYEDIIGIIEQPNSSILMAKNNQHELLAVCEIHLVGSNYFYPTGDQFKNLYFGMFTVKPLIQNQGIGKIFLQKIKDLAKKWQTKLIQITVITARIELIDYYQRRGFKLTKHVVPFPSDKKFGIPKVEKIEMVVLEMDTL